MNFNFDPVDIIRKFYDEKSKTFDILVQHGICVAEKALSTAKKAVHLNLNLRFIEEAAMLHDIGIFLTHTPELGCNGKYPYSCHGYLGRKILEEMNLAKHALVSERHVGVGITVGDIKKYNLPFPERDMSPVSLEEKVICYADKFYSKSSRTVVKEKTVEEIIRSLRRYGEDKAVKFQKWVDFFE